MSKSTFPRGRYILNRSKSTFFRGRYILNRSESTFSRGRYKGTFFSVTYILNRSKSTFTRGRYLFKTGQRIHSPEEDLQSKQAKEYMQQRYILNRSERKSMFQTDEIKHSNHVKEYILQR